MAQTKREQYERAREQIQELAHAHRVASEGTVPDSTDWPFLTPTEATAIIEWCDGYDPENATATPTDADHETNRWGETRAPSTLRQWIVSVGAFARDLEMPLIDASAAEINAAAQRMYDGDSPVVSKPLSKNTLRSRQNCIKKFLRHADAQAAPDDIAIFEKQSTVVDPEDMLTQAEFHALRQAPEHPRDRAIVDLFLYTGQRNYALRTLRIKDIDLDNGKYRLNDSADGLKGADFIGRWNPLLGAVGSIRDWLQHHPAPDDPDAYLLTERRDSLFRDPHDTISDDTVNRVLREAAAKAAQEEPGIDKKPTHAHAMRHNFVTMCKRDYDLDDDVIKRLIRHKPESDVMNTTYAHLSDEDYIKAAEEAFGLREEEDTSPMTPEHCDVCREPLPPTAKACPSCGTVFTPDAAGAGTSGYSDTDRDAAEELKRIITDGSKEEREMLAEDVLGDVLNSDDT